MSDPNDRHWPPPVGERDAPEVAGIRRKRNPNASRRKSTPRAHGASVSLSMLIGVRRRSPSSPLRCSGSTANARNKRCASRWRSDCPPSKRRRRPPPSAQTQLATELRDAQAKVTLLEARLAESQAQQAALEALYRDLAPSRDEIAISEIEQVLLVASQQLQLAGNVPSALTALQLADTKLQRLDRPQFVPLRRALSRDMDRLKAVPYVDIVGMSLKLDQAIAAVDTLPLAMDERVPAPAPDKAAPPADESAWRRLLREIWGDARQLIRIEVADRPAAPLVPAQQQYFLRENLKLRLLTARIALLARNDASFGADLVAVDAWLKQYFDRDAKPVQALAGDRCGSWPRRRCRARRPT